MTDPRPEGRVATAAPSLAALLRAARHELSQASAPPLPAAALPASAPPEPARRRVRPWSWALGSTAALAALASVLWVVLPAGPAEAPRGWAAMAGWLPVVPAESWTHAEAEVAWLVPAELPARRLAELGLPYDPGRAAESVRAELLVRTTGELLAVRLAPSPAEETLR